MAKYKIIPSSRPIVQSPISIGHKAEKGVEAIEFDLTAWVGTYGSGTATIIMRRWGDAIPYPIALEIDENNKATWTLSDTDTAKAGMAYAQLSYIVGDEVVKKSDIYTFRVMDSLTGEGEPPEAYESWLENLTHLAAEAMAEVLDIEGIVTDKTLSVDGGIADAKKTGDEISAINADLGAYNARDVLKSSATFTSRTNNDVTFTWNADNSACSVSGTSSGVACTYLFSNQTALPSDMEAGETYLVFFESEDPHCYLEIIEYDSGANGTSHTYTGDGALTLASGTVGLYIRLRVSKTATVDLTVPYPLILTAKSNKMIAEEVEGVRTDVDAINYTGVFCSNYISSAAALVSPYDDCNTIPNGDIVTYGTNILPTHAPTGFPGGTIVTLCGRNRGYSTGGTTQLCIFKTGEMFVRIRWGSNANAYLDWKQVSFTSDIEPYMLTSLSTFYKIGVVGDSFSSGSITHPDTTFDRYFDLSWIQVLGRDIGADATNYSQGGLSTKTWLTDANGLTKLLSHDPEQIYFLALGINDYNAINNETYTLGTIADITQDYTQNPDTFYGNYGRIIELIKSHAPDAIIVMLSILRPWTTTKTLMNPAIAEIADHYDLPYIFCDDDPFFTSSFYSSNMANNHPVAITYAGMAKAVRRLTERFMVENPSYFREYYGLTGS